MSVLNSPLQSGRNHGFIQFLDIASFWLSFLGVGVVIYDLGFAHSEAEESILKWCFFGLLLFGILSILIRYFIANEKLELKVRFFDGIIFLLYLLLLLVLLNPDPESSAFLNFFDKMGWVYLAVFIYFFREFSELKINFGSLNLNPAQLFIASFLFLILIGTLLLMLPNATYTGISVLDAVFTATSAVCVTGLIVVDTGSFFTEFGQTIILILIQMGGLGIMTFASYFSYFFRGKTSYENQLMLKDMTDSEKIGEVFSVLKRIVFLTFGIEFIGAVFVYFSLDKSLLPSVGEEIFFSIFHSISAFCNAGFSTLANSLYEPEFRFNYPMQLIIAVLFILGGIGFPIIFNIYKYFSHLFKNRFLRISTRKKAVYKPWIINLNTRLVLVTSACLIIIATLFFYIFEYDNVLEGYDSFGKIVVSFFSATTPRTAGFNSIDFSTLHFVTLMMIILLMWIGASPGSTGGGIKTSTFALATLNFFSLARGKDRIEVYGREVTGMSIRRAFAVVSLSLLVIGVAISLIAFFDEEKSLLSIAFECFSAYSTVGLSIGITGDLSAASKLVIIATMFIGRVSMFTILIALLQKVQHLNYRYPSEDIQIN